MLPSAHPKLVRLPQAPENTSTIASKETALVKVTVASPLEVGVNWNQTSGADGEVKPSQLIGARL